MSLRQAVSEQAVHAERRGHLLLPLLTGVVVLLVSMATGYELRGRENVALRSASTGSLQRVGNEVQRRLEEEIRGLVSICRRWERSGGLSREEWTVEARQLMDNFGDMQAIEWVDRSFHVRWIVPLEGNEVAADLDLGFEPRRRLALEMARDGHSVIATRPIDLVQGGKRFLVYVPLFLDKDLNEVFDGFVLGVYRLDSLLGATLRNVAPGFAVQIRDGDETVYLRAARGADPSLRVSTSLEILNLRWEVEILPSSAIVATHRSWLPEFVAFGGGTLALFLALAIHLVQVARTRALHLLAARNELADEITLRERAEDSEGAAWEELKAVVASLPDHVWSADVTPEGEFTLRYLSDQVEHITGRPASFYRDDNSRWLTTVCPVDRDNLRDSYQGVIEGRSDALTIEYRIERSDGEIRWIRERVRVTREGQKRRLDGVTSDITELKEAEQQRVQLEAKFQQTQKLESLGVLAGGIAHDFNNLLVGVLGHAQLALQDLPANSPVRRNLGGIEKAARRAASLCRQMLTYAGKGSITTEPIDLRETVEEMGELLSASIPKSIELRYDFSGTLPAIEADASQIRQVVMNLITNAAEAIGEHGAIEITGRAVERDRAELAFSYVGEGLEAGKYVELVVSDDGCGMDEETRERLFEPFYSTKFAGRGLGLAAVLGIVRSHGGAIKVESKPGYGTTIRLLLAAFEGQVVETSASLQVSSSWRGTGTVLVVDDEEAARDVASLLLERAGFCVLTAGDGVEALEVLERHDEIVCVLLDLTMPRMDGTETYRRLRSLGSQVSVILCSGYPAQQTVERFEGLGLAHILEKPYTAESLLLQVRNAITRRRPTKPLD